MSDVNDVLVNEEEKTVEPKGKDLLSEEVTNKLDHISTFYAASGNGKYIRIAVKSYNSADVSIILYIDSKKYQVYKLTASKQGITIPYTLKKSGSDFKMKFEVTNGMNMALSIRARQYDEQP